MHATLGRSTYQLAWQRVGVFVESASCSGVRSYHNFAVLSEGGPRNRPDSNETAVLSRHVMDVKISNNHPPASCPVESKNRMHETELGALTNSEGKVKLKEMKFETHVMHTEKAYARPTSLMNRCSSTCGSLNSQRLEFWAVLTFSSWMLTQYPNARNRPNVEALQTSQHDIGIFLTPSWSTIYPVEATMLLQT